MTEEEIAQEALRRAKLSESQNSSGFDVNAEAARRSQPPAPTNPPREQWEANNPGEDYDAAMRARAENPMLVSGENTQNSDFATIQERLKAADKAVQDRLDKESGNSNILSSAQNAYSYIPEDLKPIANMAASSAVGKVLRNNLPQEHVIGTPEFKESQEKYNKLVESEDPAYKAHVQAYQNANAYRQQHEEQLKALEAQRAAAELNHKDIAEELGKAKLEHDYLNKLDSDEEIARRMGMQNKSNVSTELTPKPRGGEATSNYALKYGASDAEARKVPSPSVMQQENIPSNANAWKTISNISPTHEIFQESPLILSPEEQKIVRERLAKEQENKIKEEDEKQKIKNELIEKKAKALDRLEKAREAHKESEKMLSHARKAHEAHAATPYANPKLDSEYTNTLNEIQEIKNKIEKGKMHPLAKLGVKAAGRFVPGAGAAFAPIEAEAAVNDWKKKNYARAITHGLGTVGALAQSTGVPLLMGAGDVMQIPAAGLSMYDLLNEKPKD